MSIVELLVITGVVIVLAAVLFPVFKVAGSGSGEAASLNSLRLEEVGMRLYDSDYDQTRVGRQPSNPHLCLSWKQQVDPYTHRTDLIDVGNPASAFKDAFSDPAARVAICMPGTANKPFKVHRRGFYWNNLFGERAGGAYWDLAGLKLSQVVEPHRTGDITEAKDFFSDEGPFSAWTKDVDSSTAWLGSAAPITHLKWNLYSDHYDNQGMNASFVDGHAGFVKFDSLCEPWIAVSHGTGLVKNAHYHTFWNFTIEDINKLGSTGSWMVPAVEQYCVSRNSASTHP